MREAGGGRWRFPSKSAWTAQVLTASLLKLCLLIIKALLFRRHLGMRGRQIDGSNVKVATRPCSDAQTSRARVTTDLSLSFAQHENHLDLSSVALVIQGPRELAPPH